MKYAKFKKAVAGLLVCVLVCTGLFTSVVSATHTEVTRYAFFGTVSVSNSPWLHPTREMYLNVGDYVHFINSSYTPTNGSISIALRRSDGVRVTGGISPTLGNFNGIITIPANRSGWYRIEVQSSNPSTTPVNFNGIAIQYTSISNRTARVYYDATYGPGTNIATRFNTATSDISSNFGIVFALPGGNIQQSALLNGLCPNTGAKTPCSTACGSPFNTQCNATGASSTTGHHKNDIRNLNVTFPAFSGYTMRLVGHTLCFWGDGAHRTGGGIANLPNHSRPRQSLVTTEWNEDIRFLMQHELSHNLGAVYDFCDATADATVRCVLNLETHMGTWCKGCTKEIMSHK